MLRFLIALVFVALAGNAAAGVAPTLQNMTVEEFLAYHAKLNSELETKQYDYVKDGKRRDIEKAQTTIRARLSGHQSMSELDDDARLAVFNAHEQVIAIMKDAELDKVTCKKLHQIGSRRPKLVCETERERRAIAERARGERVRNRACTDGLACSGI
jgi:hypothetical protein